MWHTRLKEKVGSNRKAAARLFPEWKKKARKEVDREATTERALANRIGTLHNKGDVTNWWGDRPKAQQLLADLLELEVHDIFDAPARTLARAFREFPALAPLERDEAPCRTSRAGSVFDLACAALSDTQRRRHWILVPPGGGKSLAIALIGARYPGEVNVLTVPRLVDVVPLARKDALRPVVVELEESDPATDLSSVGALEVNQGTVVVLAPFGGPNFRIRAGQARGQAPLGWNGGWTTSSGAPEPGWMSRMLGWVESRLLASVRDTKFDKGDVLGWLEAHPWVLRAVQSPGDLLALCADFDTYGTEGGPKERAERWFRTIGVGGLPEDAPRTWAAYTASDCLIAMTETHALDRASRLQERSFSGWAAIVPASGSPPEKELGCELVIGYLRTAGLLRADEHGVVVYPKWAGLALAQHRLGRLVKECDVARWGALAGDASRQNLVDAALDSLAPRELRAAGEALIKSMETRASAFADVAALEALVAAFGRRRVRDSLDGRDADLARRALVLQLDHLVSGSSVGPCRVPTTRRDPDEWFLSAWATSLATPEANLRVPSDLRWVLPGWALNLQLSEAEHHSLPWSSVEPWGASDTVQALARLTTKVVKRMKPSNVPQNVPRLLLPALFLAEGWDVTHEHLSQLAGTWEETELADASKQLDADRRKALAVLVWRLASEAITSSNATPVAERIVYLQNRHAPLLRPVLEDLPPSVVETTARTAGTHRRQISDGSYAPSDPAALRNLSLDQRAAAVRGRLANDLRFSEARELAEVLDGDDLDVLLDTIHLADQNVVAEFASRIWRVLPERAETEARRAFDERRGEAEPWFRTAPRARLGRLTEMIEAATSLPPWVQDWALAKLLDAGVYGESLFRIHRQASKKGQTRAPKQRPTKRAR